MASVDGEEPSLSEEFSFLDLQNCSPKTKSYLLSLIEDEDKPSKIPLNVVSEAPSQQPSQQEQPQQQHFTQQIYPTPPSSQPYVYINNVQANVNIHHGAGAAAAAAASVPQQNEQPQIKPMGPPPGVSASGFHPPPNPMFAANAPGLIPTNAVPYIYPHQLIKGHPGPPNPATAAYTMMPCFINLPYALPVSQPQVPPAPHAPVSVAQRAPGIMRNSPPNTGMLPAISTAAAQQQIEAFYHQQQPQQQQQPLIMAPVQEPVVKSVVTAPNEVPIENNVDGKSDEKNHEKIQKETVMEAEKVEEVIKNDKESVEKVPTYITLL